MAAGSGVVEARLLQNVVKLWIVKRLYEFVLFAQASRFTSLSFFPTEERARSSPFSFLFLTSFNPRADISTLFLLPAIDLVFSVPCSIPID